MHNKKGSFSIFACLFLLVILTAAMVFIQASKKSATTGMLLACSRTWSQSVLAEYDLNLQQRFHLFGYYGNPALVKEKLTFYGNETMKGKTSVDWEIGACDLYDDSLRCIDTFREQVQSAGKLCALGVLGKPETSIQPVQNHQQPAREVLFQDLPSEGCDSGLTLEKLTSVVESGGNVIGLIKKGSDLYFQLEYIFAHWNHRQNHQQSQETSETSYLQWEVEYIIGGKDSDSANEKAVKRRIIALREIVNLAFLEQDPLKKSAAYTAAEALTPGPAAAITAQGIMALWAYMESVNDYNLLVAGYHVPLSKTTDTWAIDLDLVLEEKEVEGCIYTGCDEGLTYTDYLKFFLANMKESTRLLRMMDLVQIQMRYGYYDRFLLSDYYGGISYELMIDGKAYRVEDRYE